MMKWFAANASALRLIFRSGPRLPRRLPAVLRMASRENGRHAQHFAVADDFCAQRVQAIDGRHNVGGEIVAADGRSMPGKRRGDEQPVRL